MESRSGDHDDHNESFTGYSQSLRSRYAPNRPVAVSQPRAALQRRPPIPEDFKMSESETDLIDTAIVIKNIPFGYPEEDFVNKLFPQLGLVPPYAFNYHRNKSDRAFHGLAFANFNAPHEAQAAVDTLNNYELDRRRLRVELKKRLPAEEEQRQRLARQSRRQLPQTQISPLTQETQPAESMPMASDILDPQLRPRIVFREPQTPSPSTELDMNDPETLGFYTTMQLFRNNPETAGAALQFPSTLTPVQRRIVHALAVKLNLDHNSHGVGTERFIIVSRPSSSVEQSPEAQVYRPFPTSRASTEQLGLGNLRSPLTPTPRLRSVASMGNLRSQRTLRPDPSTMPPLPNPPFDMFTPYDPFHLDSFRQRLGHRSSQESAVSSGSRSITTFGGIHTIQPTRQPHGPPQDQSRGFIDRPSREQFQIRPIGHGAKTPSHGSVSQGSGASRGGSDIISDLQVQSSAPPEF